MLNNTTSPAYNRLVYSPENNIDEKQMFIDHIELNQILTEKSELEDINQISEVFILFGLAVLYSAACPIVTFIVMIHNLFDIKLDL